MSLPSELTRHHHLEPALFLSVIIIIIYVVDAIDKTQPYNTIKTTLIILIEDSGAGAGCGSRQWRKSENIPQIR